MASVSFVHVEPDGRFIFHDAEGKEHVVSADKPYRTDDASLQRFLDETPFVKRGKPEKAAD